jgi:hypothetical protein
MPTTVTLSSDVNLFPEGPLIPLALVRTIYAGAPGLAVWRDAGRPIITNATEMVANTGVHASFGRETLKLDPTALFWNSNDVREGAMRFRTDGQQHNRDLDHDGKDADTFVFRFADIEDIAKDRSGAVGHGTDLWFNGERLHFDHQANGTVNIVEVRTDADFITLRWDTGHDDAADGFCFQPPCISAVNLPDLL